LLTCQQSLKFLPEVRVALPQLSVQLLEIAVPVIAMLALLVEEELVALLFAQLFREVGVGLGSFLRTAILELIGDNCRRLA